MKEELVVKGVDFQRVNPKSVSIMQLFGSVDKDSHLWVEGLFTSIFRKFALDQSLKKKWIHLDGPIDYAWVENLNSVLDDNMKLNLNNGETIKMSGGMCLLLEADNLINITPATISRCGLVYLNKQEINRPK